MKNKKQQSEPKGAFPPNSGKVRYRIIIDAFENCSGMSMEVTDPSLQISYHDVVGVLETVQHALMSKQLALNIKVVKEKQ